MLELVLPARSVLRATPRTRVIRIDLGSQSFPFTAGQAVFAGLAEGSVRRPYSIACSPGQATRQNAIELLVQIDDHNAPDPHLERVEPGTLLSIQGPFGSFSLREFHSPSLLLVAGGTGIAPLRSMMWDVLERTNGMKIALLYSARTPDEFAYREELQALASERRISLVMTVTRDLESSWPGPRGRVNHDLITGILKEPDTQCVICGPAALVADTTALLRKLGVREIVTETYSAQPEP